MNTQINSRVNGILISLQTDLDSAKAAVKEMEDQLEEATHKDRETAEQTTPYYQKKSELEQIKKMRELLYLRAGEENVDSTMPTTAMVKIVDKAEA